MDLASNIGNPKKHKIGRAILFPSGPKLFSRSLVQVGIFKNRPLPCNVAYIGLKIQFRLLQRRANNLEISNDVLKQQQAAMRAEVALLGDELHTSRVKLYEGTEQRRKDILRMKEANDRIEDLLGKLQRYGNFIRVLAGIGLDNPLYRAALSVLSNIEAEDALVNAIIESAKDKASPWARIIPAVIGPRSPENYVSALNLTLRTRKDLRERERVCEFWRAMAKMDPENYDVVTPPSSAHSDDRDDWDAEVEREKASIAEAKTKNSPTVVDDMLECLKNDTAFTRGNSTLFSTHQPTFEDMAEWVTNAAKEETSTNSSSSVLAGLNEVVHEKSNSEKRPPLYDALGILTDVYPPTHETKITLRPAEDILDSQSCTNAFDEPGPSDLISDTLAPAPDFNEIAYAEHSTLQHVPSVEQIFIVKAGEDIPQLSVQLVMDSSRGYFPFSILDSGIRSSGSEYSEMDAVNQKELEHLAPIRHINNLPEAFGSSIAGQETTSHLNAEDVGATIQAGVQTSLIIENHLLKSKPFVEETTEVGIPAEQSEKKSSQAFSAKSVPSPPRKLIGHLGRLTDSNTASRLISVATRLSKESPSRVASPSSPLNSLKPPALQTKACLLGSRNATIVASASRKQSVTASKIVVPSRPIQPPTPRNNLLGPPAKTERSPLTSSKSAFRRSSSKESLKSLKSTAHIRSKLTPPRTNIRKRPALTAIDSNLSPAQEKVENLAYTPDDHIDGSPKLKATKSSARNLGKRRGVIMMEKINLVPAIPPSAPKVVKHTTIVPTTCQIELHDPAIFSPSASEDDISSDDQSNKANTSVDPNSISKDNHNDITSIGDLPSESDLTSTPTGSKVIDHSIKPFALESSQSKSTELLYTKNPTDNLDVSGFDTHVSELIASMSDSDLDSLEMTEDSEEDFADLMVQREQKGNFSGSLGALPAFCRALIKDTPGTFGNSCLDDSAKENQDYPCQEKPLSKPVASSSQAQKFITQSLISATFGSGCSRSNSSSSSGSSSEQSWESCFSFNSPTHSNSFSKPPIFGVTRRSPRSANTSSRLDNTKIVQLESPPAIQTSLPSPGYTKQMSIITKTNNPCPRTNKSAPSSTKNNYIDGKENQSISVPKPSKPTSSNSNSSPSRLPARSNPTANPEQDLATPPVTLAPESISWIGQNILNRLSNPNSKLKANPVASLPAKSTARSYLAPNHNSPSQLKPRANTINTPPSSAPHSSASSSLTPPSHSTKPRANTVNTYSPINRSPLSQHVMNNSLEFQSRSSHPSPKSPPTPAHPSSRRSSIQKLATASRIAQSISKSITPLRVTKKAATTSIQTSNRQAGSAPPTAAFMVPNKPISSSGRRTGSSVAPLIPNCPTSSNGIISPSQCRNMLRNSLSMVR